MEAPEQFGVVTFNVIKIDNGFQTILMQPFYETLVPSIRANYKCDQSGCRLAKVFCLIEGAKKKKVSNTLKKIKSSIKNLGYLDSKLLYQLFYDALSGDKKALKYFSAPSDFYQKPNEDHHSDEGYVKYTFNVMAEQLEKLNRRKCFK